jgi:hypothetical protein
LIAKELLKWLWVSALDGFKRVPSSELSRLIYDYFIDEQIDAESYLAYFEIKRLGRFISFEILSGTKRRPKKRPLIEWPFYLVAGAGFEPTTFGL